MLVFPNTYVRPCKNEIIFSFVSPICRNFGYVVGESKQKHFTIFVTYLPTQTNISKFYPPFCLMNFSLQVRTLLMVQNTIYVISVCSNLLAPKKSFQPCHALSLDIFAPLPRHPHSYCPSIVLNSLLMRTAQQMKQGCFAYLCRQKVRAKRQLYV